ncbi:MAG: aldo/keto reductase [candidate division Zixibacteria bacterium]|nr:aldo/keto reductase [candidate division Zixibacteria bacterium]
MLYANVGQSGLKVSRLCLGAMAFGGPASETDSIRIIDRALDAGINFIDTANVYNAGESEHILGRALAGRRNRVVVSTKGRGVTGPGPNDQGASRGHLLDAVHDSLKRLRTDYIDVYFVHFPDYTTPMDETLRALDDCVRAGKIRYVACSNHYAWQVCEAIWISRENHWVSFSAVQPLYNLVNRDAEVELFPFCRAYGVGVVSYSPLARGVLSGKYRAGEPPPADSRAGRGDKRIMQAEYRAESFAIADALNPLADAHQATLTQFALAWVLANPVVSSAIIGPRTLAQLEDNLGAIEVTVTPEDETAIDGLVPPGEHTGKGYNDPMYPVRGRMR